MTRYPTVGEIVAFHRLLMLDEGQPQASLLSVEKLEGAVARPSATGFGEEMFPSLAEKAATLLQAIVVAHPFLDGNKRAGLAGMLLLLRLNGVSAEADEDALYDLVIAVTTGALREVPEIAGRIRQLFALPERGRERVSYRAPREREALVPHDLKHRTIQSNGIQMHIAEQGEGPLVIMCHGWPESWYSWRHQLAALADAGFHAVAPDQRGYGQTDKPEAIDQYTQLHLVGDIIGLMDALGEETAVIAGHDWGAPVAWNTALLRPDRIRAVIGLSVPFMPRAKGGTAQPGNTMDWSGPVRPTDAMRKTFGDRFFYQLYFQTPGVAEHELQKDIRRTLRMTLYSASGDSPARPPAGLPPASGGFLDQMADPEKLPPWLSEADLDFFTGEFQRSGFRGGLNWYRNIDRNWELFGAWAGARIQQPALFVAGDRDVVVAMAGAAIQGLDQAVPNLRKKVMLPGCGHWTQQERAPEVNAEMIAFLKSL